MTDTQRLLIEYARNASEQAFQELVSRYIDLVYSTALRSVDADHEAAKDVAQAVFVDLALKAKNLPADIMLGGWLHRHTCFVAAKVMRGERRRKLRERQAAQMNLQTNCSEPDLRELRPILDEAINDLRAKDRTAILLRFFEQLDFRSLAEAIGTNEAAAQKRVSRALAKLQALLTRRGVTLSGATLGAALATEALTAAPAGIALTLSNGALATAAAAVAAPVGLLHLIAMTKLKMSIIGAVVLAAVATPIIIQHNSQRRLEAEIQSLRLRLNELSSVALENQRLANQIAQTSQVKALADDRMRELLRLRAQVSDFNRMSNDLVQLNARNNSLATNPVVKNALNLEARLAKLKELMKDRPALGIPEFYLLGSGDLRGVAKDADLDSEDGVRGAFVTLRSRAGNTFAALMQPALKKYTDAHDGLPPTDVTQLASFFEPPIEPSILQRYKMLHPPTNHVMGGWGGWVITQKEPVDGVDVRWAVSPQGFSAGNFDPADDGPE